MAMQEAARMAVAAFLLPVLPAIGSDPERPRIVKHGTIDLDLVETTPVVFRGRLYRFEYVRDRYKRIPCRGLLQRHRRVAAPRVFSRGRQIGGI